MAVMIDAALATHMVRHMTFGRHAWDFRPPSVAEFSLYSLVRGTFSITSIAWSKTSFAITLLRITDGWLKRSVWVILVSVNMVLCIAALLFWVQCTPIQRAWVPDTREGSCRDPKAMVDYNMFSSCECTVQPVP